MGKATRVWVATLCLVTLTVDSTAVFGTAPQVKKSNLGYCHERGSPYYEQTKHFKSYDSMAECLASGGRRTAVPRSVSRQLWDQFDLDRFWVAAPYWLKRHWLWFAGGLVGLVVLAVRWSLRCHRPRGMTIPRSWRGSSSQEELERKRWEGHRLDPKK